jgi:hypothetical protein
MKPRAQLILNGSYDIAFNIDLALKDLGFALGFGRNSACRWTLPPMTNQTYIAAKAAYGGEAQSPMIAKLLEDASVDADCGPRVFRRGWSDRGAAGRRRALPPARPPDPEWGGLPQTRGWNR